MNTQVIAEVSSNHNGDLSRCLMFVREAKRLGCDAIKFQLFKIDKLFAPEILAKSEDHRQRKQWELPIEFIPEIAAACRAEGIKFICTPFYLDAVDILAPHVDCFKIASYEILWKELLIKCGRMGKPVIISTGMATLEEVAEAVETLKQSGAKDITVLHCVSGYPAPAADCNLRVIQSYHDKFAVKCGWSDHSVEPSVIYRAIEKWGAETIEFHLDLDKNGLEYNRGFSWLPETIGPVIENVRRNQIATDDFTIADGDGVKRCAASELIDREWRADPSDGLRPLLHVRREWLAKPRIVGIVRARMSSTRLPGKSLIDIGGKPLVWHVLKRLQRVRGLSEVILATTSDPSDDPLAEFVQTAGFRVFRYAGDINDVQGRIANAVRFAQADIAVNICGDCPLIHPPFIAKMIDCFVTNNADAVRIKQDFACQHEGIDVNSRSLFEKIDQRTKTAFEKEHLNVILRAQPELAKMAEVVVDAPFEKHQFRVSVDTPSDWQFIREVYAQFADSDGYVDFEKAISRILADEKLLAINNSVKQKAILDQSRKVVIRTVASEQYGLGHLKRMMALARVLLDEFFCGVTVVVNESEVARDLLSRAGMQFDCVFNDDELDRHPAVAKADLIIFDLPYEINIEKIKSPKRKVVVIDQLGEMSRRADLTILPNVHSLVESTRQNVLSGAEYVMIGSNVQKTEWQPSDYILICFGGADPANLTGQVLSRLAEKGSAVRLGIYLGPFNTKRLQIQEQIDSLKMNAFIFSTDHDYIEALRRAQAAILGFGVGAYEAAYLGMPVMAVAHKAESVDKNKLQSAGISFLQNLQNDFDLHFGRLTESGATKPVLRFAADGVQNIAKKIINLLTL